MTIGTRNEFADLCNKLELFQAVEIGTDRGDFAATFLSRWKGHTLVCVDPYEPYGHMPFDRTPDLMMAAARLAPFGSRAKILRCKSTEALAWLSGCHVDFVYIDGDHRYEFVSSDIALWWPKLPVGGILAGHDYCKGQTGVMKAVDEHGASIGHRPTVVTDPFSPASWYFIKQHV